MIILHPTPKPSPSVLKRQPSRRATFLLFLVLLLATLPGCFSERSFPAVSDHLARLSPADVLSPNGSRLNTRQWAAVAHQHMNTLIPPAGLPALTTDQLSDSAGNPVDVFAALSLRPDHLDNLCLNLRGLQQSAQVTSPVPDAEICKPWPGFESLEITMPDGAKLCARLAPPTGPEIPGSYIVLTHGLFGTLYGLDVQNHIAALRLAGHHVLALEMRGHGATFEKHPELPITFGAAEAPDLLAVARFLKTNRHATRVGLVSFSLTGYEALLAAWLDSGTLSPSLTTRPLLQNLPPAEAQPAYNAGMFIVSPPVNFLETGHTFDKKYSLLDGPCKKTFQDKAAARMIQNNAPPSHKLWDFAAEEFSRSPFSARYPTIDAMQQDFLFLVDLEADHWAAGHARLETIRSPLLILAAGNDPLATANGVAALFAGTHNPNAAAIILKEGGHMGFPALSANYYYSLMLSFFDPATGPTSVP